MAFSLIAAPVTPVKDGKINHDTISKYASLLHGNGVHGAFVNGTTGEGVSLHLPDRCALVERWVKVAPRGFKIIVHVGSTSFEQTRQMILHAQQAGAQAVGSIGPMFFKPGSVDDLASYCAKEAAVAPSMPYYFYHIPVLSNIHYPMLEFLKRAHGKIPNLAGIKYTFETLADFDSCCRFAGGKYEMLWGRDEMFLPAMAMGGARGAIGSTYNVAAPIYTGIQEALERNDLDEARRLQRTSIDFINVMISSGSFNSALKVILGWLGIDTTGEVFPPLKSLPADAIKTLRAGLDAMDFFKHANK
nr:dihydrodipicolinate synthase family protein [Candidatus Sigynarchaeota archaeon]